ncbi:MAG: STAS/SEC14 domain-containing protein [Neisseria sp.]|nr:STAS/SEC14 domain-containing protein [Neisseria sp.]
MISIEKRDYGLYIAMYGEVTLADFREFEKAALDAAREVHRPDLLLDLSALADFTIDMAWEQWKFSQEHNCDFGRIAVVVNDGWLKFASFLSGLLTNLRSHFFDTAEEAGAWLAQR